MQPFVFIHIGKTAGTSLHRSMTEAGVNCSPAFPQSRMNAEEAARYAPFRVICGHISRADQLKWYFERPIITALREPIDRCLSFIHYIRRSDVMEHSPPSVAAVLRSPILELIEHSRVQQNVHNTMVRQLGGHMLDEPTDFPALLDAAKETLRQALWVGRQGALDLASLGSLLGRPLTMQRENITEGRPSLEAEDPRVIARLYELNGYDLQLWNWAHHAIL